MSDTDEKMSKIDTDENVYLNLISKIMGNEQLKKGINDLVVRSGALNLITPNWKRLLENENVYRRLMKGEFFTTHNPKRNKETKIEYIRFTKTNFFEDITLHLIIVSPCFIRDQSKFRKCPENFLLYLPSTILLREIAKAFNKTVKDCIFLNDCTLWQNFCKDNWCLKCNSAKAEYLQAGQKVNENEPCISKTMWYNGKEIVARFGSSLQDIYSRKCLAILEVEMNARIYKFRQSDSTTTMRIGGSWNSLIAFDSDKLKSQVGIHLGELPKTIPLMGKQTIQILDEDEEEYETMIQEYDSCKTSIVPTHFMNFTD